MARPVSSIESHPQRQKIIDALTSGSTLSQIAAWAEPKVTESAICRWRRNISLRTTSAINTAQALIANKGNNLGGISRDAAMRAAMVVAADPFIARIQAHQVTLDAEIATSAGDARGIAALIGTDLKGLELHARLAGRLDQPTQQTNIMIVCPAGDVTAQADTSRYGADTDAVVIDIGPKR